MKKWKRNVLLVSLLLGALYNVEQQYSCFRLRDIEIVPGGVVPEAPIWSFVPSTSERFWLSLAANRGAYERKIESFYPIRARLKFAGWGRYALEVSPLEVLAYVHWNSRTWLLSTNGRMWPASLPVNAEIRMKLPDGPILVWDKMMPIPVDTDESRGDISPSSLPLGKIGGWLAALEKAGWRKDVHKIVASKVDGRPVVTLVMRRNGAAAGEIMLKEDTADWLQLAAAFKQSGIFPPTGENRDIIEINATFTDRKFTVKTRQDGSKDQ